MSTAEVPQFADADKAEAWQKLTDLQQHMAGLITAVEDQLSLSDSPKSARGLRAANAAEQTAKAAAHSAVGTPQQQEQKLQGGAAPPGAEPPQANEQPETHSSGVKTGCDDPGGTTACREAEDASRADEDAEAAAAAAGHEAAACDAPQVRVAHTQKELRLSLLLGGCLSE